jgi:choline dehydrogenase
VYCRSGRPNFCQQATLETALGLQADGAPGDAVRDEALPPEVIAANLATYGHPTSTVPMGGPNHPAAVVDSVGAVRGLQSLCVADASIVRRVPSTVTNLTTIMVAEHTYRRAYAR